MTLQQMEYIVAVYRLRHFAKAAEQCGVTQPTLSSMIQKLEDELGLRIFDRTAQPVAPTPAGRLVVEQAWRVLVRANKIKDIVAEAKRSVRGAFKVGILPTIAPYLLPRFFPRLLADHPETDIRVAEMKTEAIKQALARGEIDAAIVADVDGLDHFDMTELYFEQFVAYVAKGDALSAAASVRSADLADSFLWLLDEGHCFRDQIVKFCGLKDGQTSKNVYSLGSIETFMRMVEGGCGTTFIPELALDQLSEAQRRLVRPFALPIPTRRIVLLTTRTFVREAMRSLLADYVRAAVPPRMLSMNNTEQRV
mgnify:FL=1